MTVLALFLLLVGFASGYVAFGRAGRISLYSSHDTTRQTENSAGQTGYRILSLADLLSMDDAALERLDPIEVDLAVARTIPGCESLDVTSYKRTVDQWAEHVRSDTERHLYKFHENPGDYKNSLAYFRSLLLGHG